MQISMSVQMRISDSVLRIVQIQKGLTIVFVTVDIV